MKNGFLIITAALLCCMANAEDAKVNYTCLRQGAFTQNALSQAQTHGIPIETTHVYKRFDLSIPFSETLTRAHARMLQKKIPPNEVGHEVRSECEKTDFQKIKTQKVIN